MVEKNGRKIFTRSNKISIKIGFILAILAGGLYLLGQRFIKNQMDQNVIIQNNSDAFKMWSNPPAIVYKKYYFFHVKNPSEIQNGKEKPFLVEKGPYTYRQETEKTGIEFLGNELIHFNPVVRLYFEPELSVGSINDSITFLNVPAIGIIEQSMHINSNFLAPEMVNNLLKKLKTPLFETRTVEELISGYQDPLLTFVNKFLPKLVKDNKFGIFNGKNGTIWQNFTILTGFYSASSVGKIISWDGKEKLNYYDTLNANLLNGTDGTTFSPFRTRDQILYAYNADMCRSYKMVYLKDDLVDNLKTYTFHWPKYLFYNSTYDPDNEGFCTQNCLGNGVMNISKCQGGVSGFLSQPHFLNAESKFVNAVDGLKPNETEHDFRLSFEPTRGVPIKGNMRLQINFFLLQDNKIDLIKNVRPVLIPMLWFENSLELDQNTTKQLKKIAFVVNLFLFVPIALTVLGSLLLILPFVFITRRYIKKKLTETDIEDDNTNLTNSVNSTREDIFIRRLTGHVSAVHKWYNW